MKIFADGSKSDKGTGYGLFCEELRVNEFGKLPDSWSVFSTEVYAIVKALELIKRSRKTSFLILSDSLSALQAIKDIWALNPLIQLVHSGLKALNRKDIKFCWIPSHMGINGNEKADELARLGTQQQQVIETRTTFEDMKNLAKKEIKNIVAIEWENIQGNKLRDIKQDIGKWVHPVNMSRVEVIRLFRLRSGHTRFTHQHILRGEPVPNCHFCSSGTLTMKHLMSECVSLKHLRDSKSIRGHGCCVNHIER